MENSLKFFIIALCITKLIALVLLCRHGKGFLGTFWNRFRPGVIPDQISADGKSTTQSPPRLIEIGAGPDPVETTAYFCQITLYRKVTRFRTHDRRRNGSLPLQDSLSQSAQALAPRA